MEQLIETIIKNSIIRAKTYPKEHELINLLRRKKESALKLVGISSIWQSQSYCDFVDIFIFLFLFLFFSSIIMYGNRVIMQFPTYSVRISTASSKNIIKLQSVLMNQ